MRGIDYIDLLLYVIPTIVIEQLQNTNCSVDAIDALAALVKGCSISLSWEMSDINVKQIEQYVSF